MADVPQRIWARTGTYETFGVWNVVQDWSGDSSYILATPEALAAAPEVQALIRAAKAEGMREAARVVSDDPRAWEVIIAAAASAERP